jgi:hypothetical protein
MTDREKGLARMFRFIARGLLRGSGPFRRERRPQLRHRIAR